MKEQPKVVFEDEDVSFTFEPVKDLGILFVSTLYWTPHSEKRIHDAYGHFINLKRSLPKLISSQQKALAYKTYSTIPSVWLKSGSQMKQLLRSSKNFKALLPGGCLIQIFCRFRFCFSSLTSSCTK